MNLCKLDRTPLVLTFEQHGKEWHCLRCGGWFALLDSVRVEPDDEQVRLHQHLVDGFAAGERGPLDIDTPPAVAPSDGHIKCDGCGKDSGRTQQQGKPAAWYQRQDRDGVQTACSHGCIDTIAQNTGKTRVVMPW